MQPTLLEILNASCQSIGVTTEQAIDRVRGRRLDLARGLYYHISRKYGYHPEEIAELVHRKRSCVCVVSGKYSGYVAVKDKYMLSLIDTAMRILQEHQK